jgi:hypothetical protein
MVAAGDATDSVERQLLGLGVPPSVAADVAIDVATDAAIDTAQIADEVSEASLL